MQKGASVMNDTSFPSSWRYLPLRWSERDMAYIPAVKYRTDKSFGGKLLGASPQTAGSTSGKTMCSAAP